MTHLQLQKDGEQYVATLAQGVQQEEQPHLKPESSQKHVPEERVSLLQRDVEQYVAALVRAVQREEHTHLQPQTSQTHVPEEPVDLLQQGAEQYDAALVLGVQQEEHQSTLVSAILSETRSGGTSKLRTEDTVAEASINSSLVCSTGTSRARTSS